MQLEEFRNYFNQKLHHLYPKTEINAFYFRILEDKLNLSVTDVFMKKDITISNDLLSELETITERLTKEEPVQYILGHTEFYGVTLNVNPNVLIPRPETEELVSWVLDDIASKNKSMSVLDIGTGSGCIPIAIKKNAKQTNVSAIDVSEKAIHIAKANAELNETSINFMTIDILQTNDLQQQFDIIISNPPYVRELEKKELQNNVLQHEPHLALFVTDDNPLLFYTKIADLAKQYLTSNGSLFFEINQYLGLETKQMLIDKGFKSVELKKDLFGNDRMLKAYI